MIGLLAPDDLRRILKRADTKQATWQEMDLIRDHIAALEKERDAALADNAVLVERMGDVSTTLEDKSLRVTSVSQYTVDAQRTVIETAHRIATEARMQLHPGAALLEEHRKALVRARNEELEKAAAHFYEAARRMADKGDTGEAAALHEYAEIIRAMKEPESD